MATLRMFAMTLVLALALGACSGGAGVGGGGGSSQKPAGQTIAGGPASSATAGQTVDACALITAAEVQAKAGTAVSRTEHGDTSCTWWLGDDGGWIKLVVYPHARDRFDLMAPDAQPVTGLGDKAFSDGDMLVVLKGDTMLQLGSEIILSDADPAVFTRPLMETALARL